MQAQKVANLGVFNDASASLCSAPLLYGGGCLPSIPELIPSAPSDNLSAFTGNCTPTTSLGLSLNALKVDRKWAFFSQIFVFPVA